MGEPCELKELNVRAPRENILIEWESFKVREHTELKELNEKDL